MNSKKDDGYEQNKVINWKDIHISHVFKLTTPEDYSTCARVFSLELPDITGGNKGTLLQYNPNLAKMSFEDIHVRDVPNHAWCYYKNFINKKQTIGTWDFTEQK